MEARKLKTVDDLVQSNDERVELINGEIVKRPIACSEHALIQSGISDEVSLFKPTPDRNHTQRLSNMDWANVINNPYLRNLPFKIELNRWGKILMSPASNNHGRIQYEVGAYIDKHKQGGKIIMECSIQTSDGVKVADVAWASDAFIDKYGFDTPYKKAPEICVEITSPSNSKGEIEEKVQLYLARGALEVWVVDENGKTSFYSHEGQIPNSVEVQC